MGDLGFLAGHGGRGGKGSGLAVGLRILEGHGMASCTSPGSITGRPVLRGTANAVSPTGGIEDASGHMLVPAHVPPHLDSLRLGGSFSLNSLRIPLIPQLDSRVWQFGVEIESLTRSEFGLGLELRYQLISMTSCHAWLHVR